MPRVKRGVTARARHKKILALAKGFRGRRKNVFRVAKQAVMKAGQYDEALKLYQWMTPLLHLDVSAKLVQNLKLIDLLVGTGTEHMRLPRMPLIGEERAFIERVVKKALETRPAKYQSVA